LKDLGGASRNYNKRRYFSPTKTIMGVVSQTIKVEGERNEVIANKIFCARISKDCMLA